MTKFRPCIDLHAGHVKQIVGATLSFTDSTSLKTNFVSDKSAGYFASLYKENDLKSAHVILLGPGNEDAAKEALASWPNGLQIGGGVTAENAKQWIDLGAEKVGVQLPIFRGSGTHYIQVIITSYLFPNGVFSQERLQKTLEALGNDRERLVIDLSCRRKGSSWCVATNKWQAITDFELSKGQKSSIREVANESRESGDAGTVLF
jgi:phosphoribosylformimino-5-aminoimidazole carboxamide ribotide isomerase